MIIFLRNSPFLQGVWFFLALVFINVCVDIPDANPIYQSEDLSYNDQESIIEIVVEKILGYENAIIETDEQDKDEQNKKSTSKVDLVLLQSFNKTLTPSEYLFHQRAIDYSNYLLAQGYFQILGPPPEI